MDAEAIRKEVFDNLQRGMRGDLDQARKDIAALSRKVHDHENLKGWLDRLAQDFARRIKRHEAALAETERKFERDRRRARRLRRRGR